MARVNDPISDRDNYKLGLFYYNPGDDRTMIRLPSTVSRYIFNYARWTTYLIIVPFILVVGYAMCNAFFFKK